jgi:hypothetical protein
MDNFAEIEKVIDDLKAGRQPGSEVPVAYAAIQALRARADLYERELIRSLRWSATERNDKGEYKALRTWEEVARVVDAQLGSRQAAHQRWGRLKRFEEMRQPSGAAVPRSKRPTLDQSGK